MAAQHERDYDETMSTCEQIANSEDKDVVSCEAKADNDMTHEKEDGMITSSGYVYESRVK